MPKPKKPALVLTRSEFLNIPHGELLPSRYAPDSGPRAADMLRYDSCFAWDDQTDPVLAGIVLFPTFKGHAVAAGRRITLARWHSFSIRPQELVGAPIEVATRALRFPEHWFTYAHSSDYSLVRCTLAEVLEHGWRDLRTLVLDPRFAASKKS